MKRTASGDAETPCYLLAMRDADEDAERVLRGEPRLFDAEGAE